MSSDDVQGRRRRSPAARVVRRSGTWSKEGVSGLLDPPVTFARALWRCSGCQDGLRSTGDEESRWRTNVPAAAFRGNPVRARVEVGDGGRGDTAGTEAELLRRLLVMEEAWACGTTAAQRFCASNGEAEVRVRAKLGLEAAAGWEEAQRGRGRFKGGAEISACVPREGNRRGSRADVAAWPSASRGRRTWQAGRLVSEGSACVPCAGAA
jgi:hypothetical protein